MKNLKIIIEEKLKEYLINKNKKAITVKLQVSSLC
jgi:hypothetical protein